MTKTEPKSDPLPELDSTLALLGAAAPRAGLEQRVLARLATAPPPAAWYHQLVSARWALSAASVVVVAGTVTYGVTHYRPAASPPNQGIARPQRPLQAQPVSPAESVAVPDHPLQSGAIQGQSALPGRHRGVRRAWRAQHPRAVLPPGTVVPSHPHLLSAPQ